MGLWRANVGERKLGWDSPVPGPVHPAFVPIAEPSGLGWLTGFDELMCRCGLISNGAPEFDAAGQLVYPIHGRIANLPSSEVELLVDDTAGKISVRGVVEEARFHLGRLRLHATISTTFDSTSLSWHDQVVNLGGTATEIQMMYHTNIGHPQLDGGSQLMAPVNVITPWVGNPADVETASWPLYQPPQPGRPQQCYYFTLLGDADNNTQILLKHSTGDSGVGMRFNTQLPCFTQWKNEVARSDGYVTGLEPGINFPNQRSYEARHGRVVRLEPDATWEANVTLDWHLDASTVASAEDAITRLQGSHKPIIAGPSPES